MSDCTGPGVHLGAEPWRYAIQFDRRRAVEILDLRHFSSADLRPLLDDEVEMWGEMLAWDYRSSAEMILRYVDAKILPGYAAVERGSLVGYAFFVYEGSKGVIGDLFVSPRRTDVRAIEVRLLDHVIETLQQSPGVHRVEAQLLAHDTGELAEPFLANGFQRFRRLFLSLDLSGEGAAKISPSPPLKHIQIRRWTENDYQPAAGIITASYRAHIDSEINDQYRTNAGSMRFLNNIVRFPGCGVFDPEASFVAVHRADEFADWADSLLAGARRCGTCDASVPGPGASWRRDWARDCWPAPATPCANANSIC